MFCLTLMWNLLCVCVNSKKDQACLPRVMPCITHLLQDESVNVHKKIILSFSGLYRCALQVSSLVQSLPQLTAWVKVFRLRAEIRQMRIAK